MGLATSFTARHAASCGAYQCCDSMARNLLSFCASRCTANDRASVAMKLRQHRRAAAMKHPCWQAAVCGMLAAFLVAMATGFNPAAAQATKCEPGALATKYPSVAGKTFRIGQDGE